MSTFLERIKSFAAALAEYVKSGGQLVDQNTANIRAEICVACHNNKPESETRKGCCGKGIIESAAIIAVRTAIVGKNSTKFDNRLATCAICGCDNKLAIWFPVKQLGVNEDNKNAYPSFCYKKQIES